MSTAQNVKVTLTDGSADSLQDFRVELESLLKALKNKVNLDESDWIIQVHMRCKLPSDVLDKLFVLYNKSSLTVKEITEGTTAKFLEEKRIKLADKITLDNLSNTGILIGSDVYHKFIKGKDEKQGMNLLPSAGGYLLTGPVLQLKQPTPVDYQHANPVMVALLGAQSPLQFRDMSEDELDPPVHKLLDLATLGIVPEQPSPDDDWTYKQYLDSVIYRDIQYWVKLPWKLNHPQLPVNHFMAQNQLKSQVLLLQRHPENLKLYHKIIKKQLDDKFIEVVTNDNPKEGHYLPHHPVLKNSVTTQLQRVFNCSAKTKQSSVSLNDCLQTGPNLTQRLYDVLLKFHIRTYAYTADISKAFLRLGLKEEDRNYIKFLWIKDPNDPNSELITYRFASVLFGATSSAISASSYLRHALEKVQ
ncbi:uncharacterized protein [Procambarus clarkii]|uniref:uncharacterized protein n=1 Tax=Procambarus clarkii TaxID=6728 RepID=UPI0037433672